MRILEQYLAAVGSKLPWRSRKDIVDELRSTLTDQVEATYGKEPTEEEVGPLIEKFGSPAKVAAGYLGEKPVIAPGFADLFFLIVTIIGGAMLIGFGTAFLVQSLLEPLRGAELAKGVLNVVANAFRAWLSGVGAATLVFVVLSRVFPDRSVDLEGDWQVADLKGVPVDTGAHSKVESVAAIAFFSVLIVLMNLYPGIVTLAEDLFSRSGLPLGHRVVVAVFRRYIMALTVLWTTHIVVEAVLLHRSEGSSTTRWTEIGLSAVEVAVLALMLADGSLYSDSRGWIGFKVIVLIVLTVSAAELIAGLIRAVRDRVVRGTWRPPGTARPEKGLR